MQMTLQIIVWFVSGICVGWITKIPFLRKWYKDLKSKKAYELMDMYRRSYNSTKDPYFLEKCIKCESKIK